LRIVGSNLDPRVQIVQYRFTRIVKNGPSDQDLKIRIREREGLTGVDLMVVKKRLTAVAAGLGQRASSGSPGRRIGHDRMRRDAGSPLVTSALSPSS
jgi:hypothetical protein